MSSYPQRQLGALSTSAIGYGAMVLSGTYGKVDDEAAGRALLTAVDSGATFIDTADRYGEGHNERLIGRILRGRRDEVAIATKFGMQIPEGQPYRAIPVNMSFGHLRVNCDPRLVPSYAERSLSALDTDYLDLYYPHWPDPEVPIEEIVGAMSQLVHAGKVRHLGLSNVNADELRRAHAVHPVAAVQVQWAMWHRPDESLLSTARELGVGVVAWSPLGNGFLTGTVAELSERDYRRTVSRFQQLGANNDRYQPVRDLAAGLGVTPGQLALAWLLHQDPHVVPIPGSRTPAHIEENVAAARVVLSADDLTRIGEALATFQPEGTVAVRR